MVSEEPPGNPARTPVPRAGKTLEGLERALDVLALFTRRTSNDLGVSEISRELDLPKAVVHRILSTLCARDFLEVNPNTRRYALGSAWLVMGTAYAERLDIRDMGRETLARLSARTNETATLSIRHGNFRVYLDQVTPDREVIMSVQVGARYPLHAGSSSKAFLAFLPPAEQESYLNEVQLTRLTDQTVVDPKLLSDQLADLRERGYSASFGERQVGAGAVAAPVFDHTGLPVAAISVCGPAARVHGRVAEIAAALLAETRALSARLGYRADPTDG